MLFFMNPKETPKRMNKCPITKRFIADCPFCGSRDEKYSKPRLKHIEPWRLDTLWFVVCDECGASTRRVGNRHHAINIWNHRTEPTANAEDYEKRRN